MTVGIRNWLKRVSICAGIATLAFTAVMLVGFFQATPGRSFSNRVAGVADAPGPRLAADYAKLPLSFEANQGQTDRSVNFLSHGRGYSLFLTGDEAVLRLKKPGIEGKIRDSRREAQRKGVLHLHRAAHSGPGSADSLLRMKLVGANRDAGGAGVDELPGKVNYFLGNDPKTWRRNIPTYAKVRYQNVYRGVDLVYYGNQAGQLEYDFVVASGGDPAAITLDVAAHGSPTRPALRIAQDGDLIIGLDGGDVRFHKPVIYQSLAGHLGGMEDDRLRTPVPGSYVLTASHQIRFALGPYDRNQPLVIDPVLSYSTYLGGSGVQSCEPAQNCGDQPLGIAVDSKGNAYVTGSTFSDDFPTTPGAHQTTLGAGGTENAFVSKLSADGSSLVYSTYLGGNGQDIGNSIAVDSEFSAYVAGSTTSTTFPTTPIAIQRSLPGTLGAFVTKLRADGSSLVYSTYLGGSVEQEALGIAVDSTGDAYVTGDTKSSDFPVPNAPAGHMLLSGTQNAFVAALNAGGTALVYSMYLGGNESDTGYGIAVYSSGSDVYAYVTGVTSSPTFPVVNQLYATLEGPSDAFVAKLDWNSVTSTLTVDYATYLGGEESDSGHGIAVDSSGDAYVTGVTYSTNFPTANPYQATNKTPAANGTAFVAELNSTGSALLYSTYLGGSSFDSAYGITTDSSGDAYVVGVTGSTDFPTTQGVPYPTHNGAAGVADAFVTELNPTGTGLVYSTFLGGSGNDFGYGIALDSSGSAYVTGTTASADFPTFNAVETTNKATSTSSANYTGFVAKISSAAPGVAGFSATSIPSFGSQVVNSPPSSPKSVTLNNTGSGPLTIASIAVSGEFALDPSTTCTFPGGTVAASGSCTIAVNFDPTSVGAQAGTVTITDNSTGIPATQTVGVSGTGAAPPSGVTLSTPSAFAGQFVGTTSSAQTIRLTNGSSTSLAVSGIAVTGPFNLVSSGTTCSTSTPVAANGTCMLAVSFTPTATGAASGTLSITDNGTGSPQSVPLSGTGWDFLLALPPAIPASETVAPGGTASYPLNLTGLGGFNQAVAFTCTGAPSEATCAASSASASSTGTSVTVTVTTTAPSMGAPLARRPPPLGPLSRGPGILIVLTLFLAALAWAIRTSRRPGASHMRIAFVALGLLMLLSLTIVACGGSTPAHNAGTPAGTYPLTVTGTAGSGANTATHPVSLTLIVT
jgi:hypothetical protein